MTKVRDIGPDVHVDPRSTANSPGLLRSLGPGMAVAVVVGNVIGSGIFAKPGAIAAQGGSFELIISVWIAGGVLCLLGALCFAELGAMLPQAGGLYVYLREAYGRPVAFLFGWSEFLFGKPASTGALSVIFAGALANAIGPPFHGLGDGGPTAVALLMIGLMAFVNIAGVIWGGRMQGATTLVKAGFVAFVAILPFAMSAMGRGGVDFANYSSTVTPTQTALSARFAAVLLAVMWAYNGWHGITPVAEEIKNPQRNIPLALFAGIGILIVLYVGANFAYHGALSMEELAAAGDHGAERMVTSLLGGVGGALMSAGVMVSTAGAINTNMLTGPRVTFAMGRDDVFFRGLGRVHPRFRTPAAATLVQSLMAGGLVVGAGLLVRNVESLKDRNIFSMLTDFVVFSASLFYVLSVAAVIVLRRKHPEWERPYRTLGYPLTPLAYLAVYAWFLYYVYAGKSFESNVGLILIACGLPVYVLYRAWAVRNPTDV